MSFDNDGLITIGCACVSFIIWSDTQKMYLK